MSTEADWIFFASIFGTVAVLLILARLYFGPDDL